MNNSYADNFVIRDYRKGDFDQISELWNLTDMGNAKRGDNETSIEKSIKIGGKFLVLEEKNTGKICGTSWMTFDGRRIHLHHFGLLPDYQGKKLSHGLLASSLSFARDNGCQIKLEVHKSNLKAINLYKKAGFEYLGDYDVYIIRDYRKI